MAKLLTAMGKQKILVADPLNPISIKSIAIGIGTGTFDENILSLKAEVWRGDASDPIKRGGSLGFSAFVPDDIGGWEMTEWGWIDDEGDLIAYGQLDNPIYKTPNVTSFNPELFIELSNSTDAEIFVTNEFNWEHNKMTGRDADDAHKIKSITGLEEALSDLQDDIDTTENNLSTSINLDRKYKKVSESYTILNDDGGILEIDASSGPLTINMPKSTSFVSKEITLVRSDSTDNIVSIVGANGDSFLGEGTNWDSMFIGAKQVINFQAGNNIFTGLRGLSIGLHRDSNEVNLIENGLITDKILLDSSVVNNLTSTSTTRPLSAAQGRALNSSKVNYNDVLNSLSSTSVTSPLSAAQGRALNDKMLGVSQSYQDFTSSRSSNTTYTNTTGRPIFVMISFDATIQGSLTVGGQVMPNIFDGATSYSFVSFLVTNNASYNLNIGSQQIFKWVEVR